MAEPDLTQRWSVDELAAKTGVTVRTLRFYVSEGLLPPPVRAGRLAWYGSTHRARLELVQELQQHGYTLAAIRQVLDSLPADASEGELAVRRALLAPWSGQPAEDVTDDQLTALASRALSPAELDFLVGVGVLETVEGGHRAVPDRLAAGLALLAMPFPLPALQEAAAVLDRHATAVAAELTEVFRARIWEPYRRGELPQQDPAQVAVALARLRPIAVQGLVAAFERAADQTLQEPR